MIILGILLSALCAYLLGSINSAILVSRIVAKDDVRNHGSGNAGMTNILRTYGKGPAAFTAVGDFAKGAVAVLVGRLIFHILGISDVDGGYVAGFFALLGHLFPLYFGFKGGKGVLTSAGVVFVIHPPVFFILAVIVIPTIFLVKIVSLGSLLAAVLCCLIWLALRFRREGRAILTALARPAALAVSWLCWAGLRGREDTPRGVRAAALAQAVLVAASTLTIKQHVLADAASGIR